MVSSRRVFVAKWKKTRKAIEKRTITKSFPGFDQLPSSPNKLAEATRCPFLALKSNCSHFNRSWLRPVSGHQVRRHWLINVAKQRRSKMMHTLQGWLVFRILTRTKLKQVARGSARF